MIKTLGRLAAAAPLVLLAACQALIHRPSDDCPDCPAGATVACGEPRVCHKPSLMALASDLDHLEKHIDWFGSVVAKAPDVWGQARLTQHRDEFERVMAKDLDTFRENLQGSLARADQSFFQQSVALSAAVSGGVATTRIPPGVRGAASTTQVDTTQQVLVSPAAISDTNIPGVVQNVTEGKDFFTSPTFTRPNFVGTNLDPATGKPASLNIGIEPTLYLAQKKRYLDFLNQLRRENEGDDTADSPGYSLNLVRLPVSVLPGKKTDEGHGAEVTFTITPVLGEDLLPTTFRNLVANDLRQQLGFPLTQFLGTRAATDLLTDELRQVIEGMALLRQWAAASQLPADFKPVVAALSDADRDRLRKALLTLEWTGDECEKQPPLDLTRCIKDDELAGPVGDVVRALAQQRLKCGFGCNQFPPPDTAAPAKADQPPAPVPADQKRYTKQGANYPVARVAAKKNLRLAAAVTAPALSFSNGLDNKLAFPPSQIYDVIGEGFAFEIAFGAWEALKTSIERQGYAHLPDVQSYLREEVRAAQQFLAVPANRHLWDQFCTEELVAAVRSRQTARLQDLREGFRCEVERLTESDRYRRSRPENELMQFSRTAALAWCVIVDSALLTDRLVRDMKETASSKNRPSADCRWLPYFLPDPPPEARQAFNAYVQLRWPIHVFALDPGSQDQNLADSLLTRRETQLALSMAFASGRINARTLTRYARRLEAQADTIALNRTQVGFAHGEDTFGWRFYPRFQTPDTEGNLTTLVRDQLIGGPGRDALLRQRRLEPGPRECVAVVLMPSFVPNVTVDSVSNWFALTNPKHKTLDHTQALRLSRTVQALKTCGPTAGDACEYRDGEFERLLRRVGQLEARLPTQTQTVPVPVLNTLGGFEMFSNGTTDLAPELYGWYGAPGVDAKKATTLFLVGDHFSPLRTRVIVGNKEVAEDKRKMLSRQVIQVEVPADQVVLADPADRTRRYVQAHVATPYGVSRELLVPVVTSDAVTPDGYYLTNESRTLGMTYEKRFAQGNATYTVALADVPRPITFRGVFASAALPKLARVEFQFGSGLPAVALDFAATAPLAPDANGLYVIPADKLKDPVAKQLVASVFGDTPLPAATDPATRLPLNATLRVTPVESTVQKGVAADVRGVVDMQFKPK